MNHRCVSRDHSQVFKKLLQSKLLENCLTFKLARYDFVTVRPFNTIVFCNYKWSVSIWSIKVVSPLTTHVSNYFSFPISRIEEYSLSNKDMSSNQAVISAFKSDVVWIQQLKDPSLPRYLFGLYKAYMQRNTRGAAKNDTSFSSLYCLSIEIFIHSFNSVAIFGVLMLVTCGRFSWSLSRYEISLETRKRIATFLS